MTLNYFIKYVIVFTSLDEIKAIFSIKLLNILYALNKTQTEQNFITIFDFDVNGVKRSK